MCWLGRKLVRLLQRGSSRDRRDAECKQLGGQSRDRVCVPLFALTVAVGIRGAELFLLLDQGGLLVVLLAKIR